MEKTTKKRNEDSSIAFITAWMHKNIVGDYMLMSSQLHHDYLNECREKRIAAPAGRVLSTPVLVFFHNDWVIGTGDRYDR